MTVAVAAGAGEGAWALLGPPATIAAVTATAATAAATAALVAVVARTVSR
ncbi:MAG TPA: hypothetical protein VF076_07940 [Acidimicrobiales bacterium]